MFHLLTGLNIIIIIIVIVSFFFFSSIKAIVILPKRYIVIYTYFIQLQNASSITCIVKCVILISLVIVKVFQSYLCNSIVIVRNKLCQCCVLMLQVFHSFCLSLNMSEVYLEPSQTSRWKLLQKQLMVPEAYSEQSGTSKMALFV